MASNVCVWLLASVYVIVTWLPGSTTPVNVGVVSFVRLSVSELPLSLAAVKSIVAEVEVSIVNVWVVVAVFPAVSVWVTVILCSPVPNSFSTVILHLPSAPTVVVWVWAVPVASV